MILTLTIQCDKHRESLQGFTENHTIFIKACRQCLREERQAGVEEAMERMRVHLGKGGEAICQTKSVTQGFP